MRRIHIITVALLLVALTVGCTGEQSTDAPQTKDSLSPEASTSEDAGQGMGDQPIQEETQESIEERYEDGTYTVEVKGFKPGMKVDVTFQDNQITGIEVLEHKDTPKYFKRSMPEMAERILEEQTWKVDTVSNASWSSEGIKRAVRAAMEEAILEKKEK